MMNLTVFSLLAFFSLAIFGLSHITQQNYTIGAVELLDALFVLANMLVYRKIKNTRFATNMLLFSVLTVLLILLIDGGIENTGIFWFFTFPAAAFFLSGTRGGLIWIGLLYFSSFCILAFSYFGYVQTPYTFTTVRQLFVSLLMVTITVYLYERKKQQDEYNLIQKDEKLTQAKSASRSGSWEWDIMTNKLSWSDELYQMFGVKPHKIPLTYETYLSFIHEHDRERVKKTIDEALKTRKPFSFDHKIVRLDGQLRFWHGEGIVTTNSVGSVVGMIGIARDITEQKAIEDSLQQSQKDLQDFIDNLSTLAVKVAKDGTILLANKIAAEGTGLSQEDLYKTNFLEGSWWSFDPEVQERVKQNFAKAVQGERILYEEKIFVFWKELTIDFSLIPIKNADREVMYIIAEGRDISQLKKIEEDLEKSTRALQTDKIQLEEVTQKDEAILHNIGEGIIATDNKGVVLYINKATEELLFWENSELVGKNLITTIPMLDENGNEMPVEKRPFHIALKKGTKTVANCYYLRKNNSRLPIAITVNPIIVNEKIVGTVAVFRDITEEKEVDFAKTQFVTLASHQLRTPLSAISWVTEILLNGDSGPLTEEQLEFLKQIYESTKRMTQLIDSLLQVSRVELRNIPVNLQLVDLAKLSHDILQKELDAKKTEKKLVIKELYDKTISLLPLDPEIATTILRNVYSNAIKYTPADGTITVTTLKKDTEIHIIVQDTGYGIPKQQQKRIYSKLFRAENIKDKDTDGTGLGLYITKGLLEEVGGRIWFESTENKGSTFWLTLPLTGMKVKQSEVTLDRQQQIVNNEA